MRPRYLAFLLWDNSRGSPIRRHLREIDEAQALDTEHLVLWQSERLRRLLCHARDTTEFYSTLIPRSVTAASAMEVLDSLPIVTREMIRDNSLSFISTAFPMRKLSQRHSSGSTGTPLEFWLDRNRLMRQKAEIAYFGAWAGYRLGMRYLYVGPERPRVRSWLQGETSLWSTHPDDSWYEHLAATLESARVEILIAHPSVLVPFAQYLVRNQPLASARFRLRGVISISEPLLHEARLRIERALGCQVLRRYSTRETGIIASECEAKQYHLNVGSCYVEYLDLNEDHPNPNGGPCRAIVSALYNYAMPFIRYDVGDVVIPGCARCECGRPSPLLREIQGRLLDSITTPSGQTVEVFDICTQFEDLQAVRRFQFTQLLDGSYLVRVVPGLEYDERDEAEIMRRCHEILGEDVVLVVERVTQIEPLRSGKIPLVMRER